MNWCCSFGIIFCVLITCEFVAVNAVKYDWYGQRCQSIEAKRNEMDKYETDLAAFRASDNTCLSGCVTPGTVEVNKPCFSNSDCQEGAEGYVFCGSTWKICTTGSASWSIPKAGCSSSCSGDFNECSCSNADFPNNWVQCTNEDRKETCDSSKIKSEPVKPAPSQYTRMMSNGEALAEDDDFAVYQVCYHNKFRQEAGLQPVEWDHILAKFAKYWTDWLGDNNDCRMKHSTIQERREYDPAWSSIGENIYWHGCSLPFSDNEFPEYGAKSAEAWYSELKFWQYAGENGGYDDCPFREPKFPTTDTRQVRHLTQLMWNETTHIGCYYRKCVDYRTEKVIVCNYGPGGNSGMWQWVNNEQVLVKDPMISPENYCKLNANPETIELYGNVTQCKGSPIDCDKYV